MGDESPQNKVKFLCSYGGKVLPRPSDGHLKYVGGETRVVSVPRDITFPGNELMKKVNSMVEGGDMVLKYQVGAADLDMLVSVRTEEDMKHMIDEHDRLQTGLLRAFLYPSNPTPSESFNVSDAQRYIDAINGIMRTSPTARSSTCSSPKSISPDSSPLRGSCTRLSSHSMQRVRSSPSLTNLSANFENNHYQHHHPHLHPLLLSHPSSRPPQDPPPPQMMRALSGRSAVGVGGYNYYYSTNRPLKSSYAYQEDHGGHFVIERMPRSSRKSIWE
ncbi:hypothetical protein RJT34_13259 [Clitoria ternatea]|uniref:PB1 domain-containing protein n=1 Tax=Clitoria ternatea TaxID=43366 RepID=A0AAN9JQK5_CLITE